MHLYRNIPFIVSKRFNFNAFFLINITHIFLGVIRNNKLKRKGQTMILQNTTQKTKD